MKKIISILVLILLHAVSALAAGGGGGGSFKTTPACTEDVWTCSDWSRCSSQESQTRSCTLTVDCATVSTPRPVETADCIYVSELLSKLKCADLRTVQERVRCRLKLSPQEINQELQIQFLPEECRSIDGAAQKEACVKRYADVQKCWQKNQDERVACVKGAIKVGDIASQVKDCKGNRNCIADVKDRVYQLIKWRFYDLEERAEEMLEEGKASEDQVTDFVSDLELKKDEFNNAKTKAERRKAILDVRQRWQRFIKEVKA